MNAKLQSKILFVAVLGTVGLAHAAEVPQADTSTTKITNTLSNNYANSTTSVYGTSYSENIAVFDVFDPNVSSLASAKVNDIQKNLNNTLNVTDPSSASVSDSVKSITGNAGVNNAAGFFNQQANNVAIASVSAASSGGKDERNSHGVSGAAALASVSFEQLNKDNDYRFAQPQYGTSNDMTASISNSVKDIQGNVGLNNASGAGNQQKNDVALASAESAVLSSASAGGIQINQNTQVSTFFPLNVTASLSDSVKNVSGNVGVNNAAGLANQQINTLSVAASR